MRIRIEVDEEAIAKWLLERNNLRVASDGLLYPEVVEVEHSDCMVIFTLEVPS